MRRYSQCIDEQVGEEPDGPLGPEVKAMNLPKPKKYAGEDDINKFDKWLVQLLAYFWIFKITGLRTDATRVQYTGLYLSELAQQWYSQEVLAPTRYIQHWTFEDLIFGLFSKVLKSGPVRFFSLFGRQLNWTDSFSLPKEVGLATGLKATSCDQLPPSCNQSWITNHSIW